MFERSKKKFLNDYFNEKLLEERLWEYFGSENKPYKGELSVSNDFVCYHLVPLLNPPPTELTVLGDTFTIVYEKPDLSDKIYLYFITPKSIETLKSAFSTEKSIPNFYPFFAKLYPTRDWLIHEYVFKDLPGVAESLPQGTMLSYSITKDHYLVKYLLNKNAKLKNRILNARKESTEVNPISRKLDGEIYSVKICVFASDNEKLDKAIKLLEKNLPPFYVRKRLLTSIEDENRELLPQKPNRFIAFAPKMLTVTGKALENAYLFPNPSLHHTMFTRSFLIPRLQRTKSHGIKIGSIEGKEDLYLSQEDFYRHAYTIGQTGSGKTNLMKLIVSKLQDCSVFVIDPHGSLADELAETLKNPIYLSPIKSPFGLNPLKLPPLEDRDQAILISIDVLMNLFTNVFNLPETAINVRYILQTVTRQIYKLGVDPTLAGIYQIVMNIYNGADIGIMDETFREHEKMLRNMPDQSFISTLGRLQSFAEDPLLRKITSTTTIEFDKLIEEKRPVLFSIPQSDVGMTASTLLCSSLLLNLYYTVLMRYQKGKREHVFVVIDEFQTLQSLPILANILSEARKFGLHLIIAHQYVEQLSENVFQAAMNNSALKFIFQVTGDVQKFKTIDPTFGEEIMKILPSLSTGECLVKIVTTSEDAQIPPMLVKIDKYEEPKIRSLNDICTNAYAPEDVELSLEAINPLLKYIEIPFPPKQKILYGLYKRGGESYASEVHGFVSYLKDSTFNKLIQKLSAEGYLVIVRKGKSERILKLTSKFFEDFRKISRSEKGRTLVDIALLWYLENNYYVEVAKNTPIPRPDFIVIPYTGTYYLDYLKAVEVEIEATTAEKNEEHLIDTMTKTTPLKERHVWCFEDDLQTILKYAPKANKATKVFAVSLNKNKINMFAIDQNGVVEVGSSDTPFTLPDTTSKTTSPPQSSEDASVKQTIKTEKTPNLDLVSIIKIIGPKRLSELKKIGMDKKFFSEAVKLPDKDSVIKFADELLTKSQPDYLQKLKTFCPPHLIDKARMILETHGTDVLSTLEEAHKEGVLEDVIDVLLSDISEKEPQPSSSSNPDTQCSDQDFYSDIDKAIEEAEKIVKEKLKSFLNGRKKSNNLPTSSPPEELKETAVESKTENKKSKNKKKISNMVLDDAGKVIQKIIVGSRTLEVSPNTLWKIKRDITLATKMVLQDKDQKIYELSNAPPGIYNLLMYFKDGTTKTYLVKVC